MREIKFRVWCQVNEEMNEVERLGFSEGRLWYVEDVDRMSQPPYFIDDKDFALMQYIGLKDKNGREVFEGDIVKRQHIQYTDCSRTEIESVGEVTVGEIYYVEGVTIGIKLPDGSGQILFPFHLLDSSQDFEVIGNIYENPELLGDANE